MIEKYPKVVAVSHQNVSGVGDDRVIVIFERALEKGELHAIFDRLNNTPQRFVYNGDHAAFEVEAEGVLPQDRPDCARSFDARDWSQAFIKQNPSVDESTALAWFANAIMRGYDEALGQQDQQTRLVLEEAARAVALIGKYRSVLKEMYDSDGESQEAFNNASILLYNETGADGPDWIDHKPLLREVEVTMRHARVFLTSREKMHEEGVKLWDALRRRIIDEVGCGVDLPKDDGDKIDLNW